MSWGPLRPARIDFSNPQAPASKAYGDATYPVGAAALARAQRVYLAGSHLPTRWAGRRRFVVLETGFGLGHNFLATWAAWQQDARRCDRLWYVAVDKHPPLRSDLARAHAGSALPSQAAALVAAWPPLTPDLHLLDFDGGRVRLLLALGDISAVLPDLVAQVDAFYLDGFAAALNPAMWDAWRLRQLPRLAAAGATVVAGSAHNALRDGLSAAGFVLDGADSADGQPPVPASRPASEQASGGETPGQTPSQTPGQTPGPKTGTSTGRFAPRFQSLPPAGRQARPDVRRVAVVGAGLAGSAVAWALAARGLAVQVFDRQAGCAGETSGNPGGLFHGTLHGHDGSHARWLRAAALHTERVLRPMIDQGLDGAIDGLLRGEQAADADGMDALVEHLALPADYVQVRRNALIGGRPAWFYPGGGWVAAPALCAHWLASPGISTHFGLTVAQIQPLAGTDGDPARAGWRLLDAAGRCLAEVDALLLCNASEASRLVAGLAASGPGATRSAPSSPSSPSSTPSPSLPAALSSPADWPAWPLRRVRGQTTLLPAPDTGQPPTGHSPTLPLLALPLADTGYALRLRDGRLLCGASAQPDDEHSGLRAQDHASNLATLRRLTGWTGTPDLHTLSGRVGWRVQSEDRLPLLGPVPAAPPSLDSHRPRPDPERPPHRPRRLDQPRLLPRQPGLYVFTALGARGITQAALGAEVLASWLTGDPVPAPASLLDALDPARFAVRALRRAPAAD
jgi:tRNA 5-methylaminomethyl-2-thiouridine biosynthesis bifunctional protein